MSKIAVLFMAVVCAALIIGCATPQPVGAIFTDVKLPITATSNSKGTKVGRSQCTSLLSLIATGDASIAAAMKDGGITKVSTVDWEAKNILGIIGTFTCIVTGE